MRNLKLLIVTIAVIAAAICPFASAQAGGGAALLSYLDSLPVAGLPAEDAQRLVFVREEQKLARDVYFLLYARWGLPILASLLENEQFDMDAVKLVLARNEIPDPVAKDDVIGRYRCPELNYLLATFVMLGEVSENHALCASSMLQEMTAMDLDTSIANQKVQAFDVGALYQNLLRNSCNHLRALSWHHDIRGIPYMPIWLHEDVYHEIVATPWQVDLVDWQGAPIP